MSERKIGKLTVELDANKFSEQLAEVADVIEKCAMRIQRTFVDDETSRYDCMRGKCDCEPDRSSGVPFFGSLCEDNAAAVVVASCDDLKAAWSVGDELQMHLKASEDGKQPEQDVVWVVMGFDCKELIGGRSSRVVIGLKDGLENLMAGGERADMWFGNVHGFVSMLPAWFADLFSITKNRETSGYSFLAQTFWLPSETEVFGCTQWSDGEMEKVESQLPYYERRRDRRVKHQGIGGAEGHWWERSPYRSSSIYFCRVDSGGGAKWDSASDTFLLSPCGCL